MKKLLLLATVALLAASPVKATTLEDPLLSYVCSGAGTGCAQTDNGTFSPLAQGSNFGFEIAPGPATGNLTLAIFVPTNLINVSTFNLPSLTENGSGVTTNVFSRTTLLNVGDGSSLATYLGLPNSGLFSPTDNFANLTAGETTVNPLFGGNLLAFTVTLNGVMLDGNGSTTLLQDFLFGSNLPTGTVIAGFFVETLDKNGVACDHNCYVGTAASNDLLVSPQLAETPIPGAVWLFASGIGGLHLLTRRRRKKAAAEKAAA